MNFNGLSFGPNLSKALDFYITASEFGVIDAQNKATHQLEAGEGCENNLSEAFKWYYIAADTGDDWASVKIPYSKLVGVTPFSDGLEVHKEEAKPKRTVFQGFGPWFVLNVLNQVNNFRHDTENNISSHRHPHTGDK